MALTITNVDNSGLLNKRVVFCDLAFDSSYPTGGEALVANTLGMLDFHFVLIEPKAGYVFTFDRTNNKVMAYWTSNTADGEAMVEVTDSTDLAAVTGVKVMAIGV